MFRAYGLTALIVLSSSAIAASSMVEVTISAAGVATIEGARFETAQQLQSKLAEVSARTPRPMLSVEIEGEKCTGWAEREIDKSGLHVGYLVLPSNCIVRTGPLPSPDELPR
jgi:hypothetical protein